MPVDAKLEFGILADGSDETTKIADAFALACSGELVHFGAGIYGAADIPDFQKPPAISTSGIAHTTFKNLSPTSRMFHLKKHEGNLDLVPPIPVDLKTSFADFGGFALDQNGCTGNGVEANAQFSFLRNIMVKNQAGDGYAIRCHGTTLGGLDNIMTLQCSNGVELYTALYMDVQRVSIERTTGRGFHAFGCAVLNAGSLYLDSGQTVSGVSAAELMLIDQCFTANFQMTSSEQASGTALSSQNVISVQNSTNINFQCGRINNSNGPSVYQFRYGPNSTGSIKGVEWVQSQAAGIFAGLDAGSVVEIDGIDTHITTPVGGSRSKHGVAMWAGLGAKLKMGRWRDRNEVAAHTIHASSIVLEQTGGGLNIVAGSGVPHKIAC